jgi:hypothetical protein
MTIDNVSWLLQTPSGTKFLDRIATELKSGNNVIVYAPDPIRNDTFLSMINTTLKKKGIYQMSIASGADYKGPPNLASLMAAQPDITKTMRKKTFADYFKSNSKDMLFIRCISNLENFPSESHQEVFKELTEACQASRVNSSTGQKPTGLRFLAVLSPRFASFPNMEGVVTINWWGVTSSIDHNVIFEDCIDRLPTKPSETMYWWLKAVCLGVGDDDPWLINELVNHFPMDLTMVANVIKTHPLYKKHSKTLTANFDYDPQLLYTGVSREVPPPPEDAARRLLWAQGLLNPGRLCSYHPVVLVLKDSILKKFVITGQVHVFFPLVEQVMGTIIQIIESRLGEGVWDHYIQSEKHREDALCEIGPLSYHLKHTIKPTDNLSSYLVYEVANLSYQWRQVRHLSAHLRICEFTTLENAINLYHEAEKYLNKNCPIIIKTRFNQTP